MHGLTTSLFLALAAVQSATALPPKTSHHSGGDWLNQTTGVVPTTQGGQDGVQTQSIDVSVNCNELINQVLGGVSAYPDFVAQAVAVGKKVGLPAGTAFSVCKMFKTDAIDCTYAAGSVAGAISLAISNGYMDLVDEGSEGASPSKRGGGAAAAAALEGSSSSSFQDRLERIIAKQGVRWDDFSVLESSSSSRALNASIGSSPHTAQIRGAKFPGRPATDFNILKSQQGRGGFVHASPTAGAGGRLGRRQDTFGFKVNYEVFNRSDSPSEGSYDSLAQKLADDWNSRVSSEQDIGDYIGLADFGYMGYIQFRVIPETSGYGLNPEDVGTCSA